MRARLAVPTDSLKLVPRAVALTGILAVLVAILIVLAGHLLTMPLLEHLKGI